MDRTQWAKPGPYLSSLAPEEEARFQEWVSKGKVPWREDPQSDYDMRLFFKENPNLVKAWKQGQHFPDTYKTPAHKSFSRESRYATEKAPKWVGPKLMLDDGTVIFDESPTLEDKLFRGPR